VTDILFIVRVPNRLLLTSMTRPTFGEGGGVPSPPMPAVLFNVNCSVLLT